MRVEPVGQWQGLDAEERRRRRLAERLAVELATASHRAGSDFVASRAVAARLGSALEVQLALGQAGRVIAGGPASEVGQAFGRGGLVLYVHGPDLWSVVVPFDPFTGLVLVCADDLKDTCLRLRDDSPEARSAVADFHTDIVLSLANRRHAIESGFLPPDPQPLGVAPTAAGGSGTGPRG